MISNKDIAPFGMVSTIFLFCSYKDVPVNAMTGAVLSIHTKLAGRCELV